VIEVPSPRTFEGRTLRYGAMTCGEYIWFRSKWTFASCGFTFPIGIYQFTVGTVWGYAFGAIILVSSFFNLFLAFRWRRSWAFWHMSLEWFLSEAERRG
jgi:hypothetical protein